MENNEKIVKIIREVFENYDSGNFNDLVQLFLKRVPSLKKYNRFDFNNVAGIGTKFQKQDCFGEKSLTIGNELIKIDSLCSFSEFIISYRKFNERKWFYVTFRNEVLPTIRDKNVDYLQKVVLYKVIHKNNDQFFIQKEIALKENDTFPEEKLNELINEINKKTFLFEDHLKEYFGIYL